MPPLLFHFSCDPAIELFVPRAVRTPAKRPLGHEWLNGPLVWAIDDWHQPMYLFPRDCPRILLWRTPSTVAGPCPEPSKGPGGFRRGYSTLVKRRSLGNDDHGNQSCGPSST